MKKQSTFKILKSFAWPQRGNLFLGFFLIVLSKLALLVIPLALKHLVDDSMVEKDSLGIRMIIFIIIGAILVHAICSFFVTRIVSVQSHKIIAKLRSRVYQKVLRLPLSFFQNQSTGTITKRIMDDVDGLKHLLGTGFVLFVGGIITAIGTVILLLTISVKLTLFVLLPLIFIGFLGLKAFKFLRPIFRKRRKIEAEVHGRLTESLGGMSIVKLYQGEQIEKKVFEKGVFSVFQYYKKSLTGQALITSGASMVVGVALAIMIWLGSEMILNETLTVGSFLSFALYLAFMITPIIQMSSIGSLLTEALSGLDRTTELLNETEEEQEEQRDIVLQEFKGNLKFQEVSFQYEENIPVLKKVSFEVNKGTVTALVGPSGSGKSTIASLIATFIAPKSGEIYVDGYRLSKVTLSSYRSRVAMVLQDDFLFDGTLKENICYSNPKASNEELDNAVKTSNVHEFSDTLLQGLDTIIGERGVKLSGGQKQRVSIARAILANPDLLILDEATSSLDAKSEMLIQEALKDLVKGRTTIVIAHRLSTIRNANQILYIDNGEILERGTHEELMLKEGAYFNLINIQSRI